ncbi:hypothetical protein BpHYR1_038822 [Brachionus plicatilis]|uniref:Uncharacterized protein n=1 Tax=Brachionus plicatilis TaxID=10195 RepID=A0A3M7SAN0_BRAPC|nr:hypothetical protein BpHYR1_038822 [Brachionus plicatilis]
MENRAKKFLSCIKKVQKNTLCIFFCEYLKYFFNIFVPEITKVNFQIIEKDDDGEELSHSVTLVVRLILFENTSFSIVLSNFFLKNKNSSESEFLSSYSSESISSADNKEDSNRSNLRIENSDID